MSYPSVPVALKNSGSRRCLPAAWDGTSQVTCLSLALLTHGAARHPPPRTVLGLKLGQLHKGQMPSKECYCFVNAQTC